MRHSTHFVSHISSQRAHHNYLEFLTFSVLVVLISGLRYPRVAVIGGIVYIIARYIYALGYRMKGPNGRAVGAIVSDLALLALLFASFSAVYHIGGGIHGIKTFFNSFLVPPKFEL